VSTRNRVERNTGKVERRFSRRNLKRMEGDRFSYLGVSEKGEGGSEGQGYEERRTRQGEKNMEKIT